jgi:hypothetical protein
MVEIREMTKEEWIAEGTALFGDNLYEWRFVCPSCGNIQSIPDFFPYKDRGATPNTAYFNCIGRYDGHGNNDILSGKKPCNYTNDGLLCLAPIRVIEDGEKTPVFDFDRSGGQQ